MWLFRWLWGGVARLECFGDINKWLQKSERLQIMKNFKNAVMRCLIHYKVPPSFEDPKKKKNQWIFRAKKRNKSLKPSRSPPSPAFAVDQIHPIYKMGRKTSYKVGWNNSTCRAYNPSYPYYRRSFIGTSPHSIFSITQPPPPSNPTSLFTDFFAMDRSLLFTTVLR